MDLKPNNPLLAEVEAPWGRPGSNWRFLRPRYLWRVIAYNRKYGWFWAPASMDAWRYRRFLKDLDEVCLRSLKSHGALTARELADWLNRESLLRTKPDRTGIHRISVATVHDWINLARRRGYVLAWSSDPRGGSHWELSERGHEAIRSKFATFAGRLPYPLLAPLLLTGGGFVATLNWLERHPTAIVVTIYALLLAVYISALMFWFGRSERRENPGIAVVAIETLRCTGTPLPALTGG